VKVEDSEKGGENKNEHTQASQTITSYKEARESTIISNDPANFYHDTSEKEATTRPKFWLFSRYKITS
jgi:hypothetical protein